MQLTKQYFPLQPCNTDNIIAHVRYFFLRLLTEPHYSLENGWCTTPPPIYKSTHMCWLRGRVELLGIRGSNQLRAERATSDKVGESNSEKKIGLLRLSIKKKRREMSLLIATNAVKHGHRLGNPSRKDSWVQMVRGKAIMCIETPSVFSRTLTPYSNIQGEPVWISACSNCCST